MGICTYEMETIIMSGKQNTACIIYQGQLLLFFVRIKCTTYQAVGDVTGMDVDSNFPHSFMAN